MDMISPKWTHQFNFDPIKPLLESGYPEISYYVKKDLLDQSDADISQIVHVEKVRKIIRKQHPDGYWRSNSPNRKKHPAQNYDLLETFRYTNMLIHMYGLDHQHPCIEKAVRYLFSCQTEEGDIRGILGDQYTPYYNGIIVSILNRAGCSDLPQVERIIQWLLEMRQSDGGWVIGSPGCMRVYSKEMRDALTTQFVGTRQDFDRDQPSGHAGTGMVLRAFATHPYYCRSTEAHAAGEILADSLFQKNTNNSYRHPDNWLRFNYPFWWIDLISALDSLSRMGFSQNHPKIADALSWFIDNQLPTGLWRHSYSRIHTYVENSRTRELQLWISLAILRIFKRYAA